MNWLEMELLAEERIGEAHRQAELRRLAKQAAPAGSGHLGSLGRVANLLLVLILLAVLI